MTSCRRSLICFTRFLRFFFLGVALKEIWRRCNIKEVFFGGDRKLAYWRVEKKTGTCAETRVYLPFS